MTKRQLHVYFKQTFYLVLFCVVQGGHLSQLDAKNTDIWGPGLFPDVIVLPARYFFIHAVDTNGKRLTESPGDVFKVHITGEAEVGACRIWVNILDRKDGSYIVRYKQYNSCRKVAINVQLNNKHVGRSPFTFTGPIHPETCYCPEPSIDKWLKEYGCKEEYEQIVDDMKPFTNVNFTHIKKKALKKLNQPGSISVCNYIIKENKIFRKCYGQHVGFKIFSDAILLSLTRKVQLPDMEFLINLGDWPLVKRSEKFHFPLFSWCGSDDTLDIVLPTYDITESSLECMGRVMLDMLSVQGNVRRKWENKIEKGFWRGRDSSRERLKLIEISRKNPNLINASLTNFFFYKDEEEIYGPKEQHISFFNFFDFKYQINLDGTVAAYRFPYLLGGDSLVFKQNSKYYEHFYKELTPWTHYIPVKKDLSDLVSLIKWAKEHDVESRNIAGNGTKFARENLLPQDIFCYYASAFNTWSHHLFSSIEVESDMEYVPQPTSEESRVQCQCHRLVPENIKDEL